MAIERNICGHEVGDMGELIFGSAGSGGIPGAGIHSIQSGGRTGSGNYFLRTTGGTLSGNPFFSFFPAGAVIGTSGTVTSGNKKRARVRVYVRTGTQFFSFPTSQEHVFGFGGEAGTAGVWIDGNRRFGVRVGGGAVTLSSAAMAANTFYRFILDVEMAVSANTTITATLTVTEDSDTPLLNESVVAVGNIGASDTFDALGVGEVRQSIFGISGTYDFDDWCWIATSDADAVSAITLPDDTHIYPLVPPTGVALNQWETGTYLNVDEVPPNGTDTMSSVLGTGTEVEFTHASGLKLGLGRVQAVKSYIYAKVASGTGSVDFMLNGVAKSVTLAANYPGASDPVGGVLFSTMTSAQFGATTFGVKKQNGTQQTFIASAGLEVLASPAAVTQEMQIRGETQIKAGSIYDAQIADAARIQAHKVIGLGTGPGPIFFPDEAVGEDWMIPGPPGSAAQVRIPVVPVFLDADGGGGEDGPPGPPGPQGPQGAAGAGGGGGGTSYNGQVLLAELTAAGSASLDFATRNVAGQSGNLFQSDYDEYIIEFVGLVPGSNNVGIGLRVTTDGGATYVSTGSYAWTHWVYGPGGTGQTANTAQTEMRMLGFINASNTGTFGVNGAVRVLNPRSTALHKVFGGQIHFWDTGPSLVVDMFSAAYSATTAIDGVRVVPTSGTLASGVVRVYGLTKTPQSLQQAPAHGLVLLAAQTAAASATLDFVSRNVGSLTGALFQSDYDEYLIEFVDILPASAGVQILWRMSTNGGSSYDASGIYDTLVNFAFGSTTGSSRQSAATGFSIRDTGTTIPANTTYNGTYRLMNPLSAFYKTVMGQGVVFDNGLGPLNLDTLAYYKNTAACNAMRVLASSGNITSGSVRVYGIVKDATYPVSSVQTGTHASRPSAGNTGRIYLPNDGYSIGRDSGTAWETWGPVFPFTPPPTGVWSWLNQGSSTIAETKDSLQLFTPAHGNTNDFNCREKNTPATPYTMTAYLKSPGVNKNNHQWGVFLRQAGAGTGTGRIMAFFNGQAAASVTNPGLDIYVADLASTASAFGTFYRAVNIAEPVKWFRIADNGTDITFSISGDGQTWVPILTQSRLTYLLQGPDRIGFFYHPSNTATPNLDGAVTVMSWKEQ